MSVGVTDVIELRRYKTVRNFKTATRTDIRNKTIFCSRNIFLEYSVKRRIADLSDFVVAKIEKMNVF